MVEPIEIWRSANILIRQHGDDAALAAAQRADELLAAGDVEGARVLQAVVRAIGELQRGREEDEALN